MLTNCISAGLAICARAAFPAVVAARASGMDGAINAGTLKEAKIVTLSRRQKREYETFGMVGAVAD